MCASLPPRGNLNAVGVPPSEVTLSNRQPSAESSRGEGITLEGRAPEGPSEPTRPPKQTTRSRIGATWVALALGLALAIAVLVFIIQNSQPVRIEWIGLHVRISLAVALLLAAVGGALVAILVGSARIVQLRVARRRAARRPAREEGA